MLYAGDAPTPDVTTEPYEIPEKRIASDAGHNTAMSSVLVTGGSGFVATHCILQLLAAGHEVRTTVRRLSREPDVRAMLKTGCAEPGGRLSFVEADLERKRHRSTSAIGRIPMRQTSSRSRRESNVASAFRGTVHQRGDSQSACHATATVVKSVPVRTVTPDAYATLNE